MVDRVALNFDAKAWRRKTARTGAIDRVAETALRIAKGIALVRIVDGEELTFSEQFACADCGISLGELEPRNFSFNSPQGACPDCTGLGVKLEFDPELVVPNPRLSLDQGAIAPWMSAAGEGYAWYAAQLDALAELYGFSTQQPFNTIDERPRSDLAWSQGAADNGQISGTQRPDQGVSGPV
ncbi:MAG: hypothetical protein R2848_08120 [Thermomicrobiales bacterium]